MSYILKGESEACRLDEQTSLEQFSLEKELAGISFTKGTKVLDAGCGSGILCRYIEDRFPEVTVSGCDMSTESLAYARSKTHSRTTKYFEHDFVAKPFETKYDFIFNRLVAHHLTETKLRSVFKNFYESLNQGGEVCVIDPDGIFLNVGTVNHDLLHMMNKVKAAFQGNLTVGRLVPSLLKEAGFQDISWRIEVMDFQNGDRAQEVKQWNERFRNSFDFYANLFGSELEARRFLKLYVEEVSKAHVPMFYNKFIIKAFKR